jgi:hypothetical protein
MSTLTSGLLEKLLVATSSQPLIGYVTRKISVAAQSLKKLTACFTALPSSLDTRQKSCWGNQGWRIGIRLKTGAETPIIWKF